MKFLNFFVFLLVAICSTFSSGQTILDDTIDVTKNIRQLLDCEIKNGSLPPRLIQLVFKPDGVNVQKFLEIDPLIEANLNQKTILKLDSIFLNESNGSYTFKTSDNISYLYLVEYLDTVSLKKIYKGSLVLVLEGLNISLDVIKCNIDVK